jgi:hypothetical protein
LVLLALLAVALLVAGPANARHDTDHPFSGKWEMGFSDTDPGVRQGQAKTATLIFNATDKTTFDNNSKNTAIFPVWGTWAGTECGDDARDFYVGTFSRGDDTGDLVACVHPVSTILHAVFKSKKYSVEGAITTAGGPGGYGVFPSQPNTPFNSLQFLGHVPGDGAKAEEVVEESLCPSRTPAARNQTAPAKCRLDRVVFYEGTNVVHGVADSERAVVGQWVYFLANVTSKVVPAQLLLLLPPEAKEVEVVPEAKSGGLACDSAKTVSSGKYAGKRYLLCTIDRAKSRVLVAIRAPKTLSKKKLEVLLLVRNPQATEAASKWLARQTLAVDVVDVAVVQPKPAPPKPTAAPKDPIEGRWVGFAPKPRVLPGRLDPLELKDLNLDAEIRIGKAQPEGGSAEGSAGDVFMGRGNYIDVSLNKPRVKTYLSGFTSMLYDGKLDVNAHLPPGHQLRELNVAIQLELIRPGSKAVSYPPLCLGIAEQANAPILCGLVTQAEGKVLSRLVLKRVSD